jgi:hypothetical protein
MKGREDAVIYKCYDEVWFGLKKVDTSFGGGSVCE